MLSLGGESHLPQEVHDGAEVSWNDLDQSHGHGEHQGWSWYEAMHMNHGQKSGLGNKVRCKAALGSRSVCLPQEAASSLPCQTHSGH